MAKFFCKTGNHEYQIGLGHNTVGHNEDDVIEKDCPNHPFIAPVEVEKEIANVSEEVVSVPAGEEDGHVNAEDDANLDISSGGRGDNPDRGKGKDDRKSGAR